MTTAKCYRCEKDLEPRKYITIKMPMNVDKYVCMDCYSVNFPKAQK